MDDNEFPVEKTEKTQIEMVKLDLIDSEILDGKSNASRVLAVFVWNDHNFFLFKNYWTKNNNNNCLISIN